MLIICLFLCTWIRRACVFIFWAMSLQLRHSKSRLLGLCKQNERAAETSKCINGWMPAKKDLLQQDPLNPNHLLPPLALSFHSTCEWARCSWHCPEWKEKGGFSVYAATWRMLQPGEFSSSCSPSLIACSSRWDHIYIYHIYHIYSIYSRTRLGLVKCRLLMAFHAILNAFE